MKYELNDYNRNKTDQELLVDLKRVAEQLRTDSLASREYLRKGKYSDKLIMRRFGGWNKALEKAGLKITQERNISENELFQNIEEVWIKLGRQPMGREMKQPLSKYSRRPYLSKYGSWMKALVAFIQNMNTDDDQNQEMEENNSDLIQEDEIVFKHTTKRDTSLRIKVQVLMRDGNKCRLCGITVEGDNIHFDHIKPWSKGGETVLENLQILCATHNLAKSNLE